MKQFLNPPFVNEYPHNREPKLLVTFVIDTSTSMSEVIDIINNSLFNVLEIFKGTPSANERVEICLITFDSEVKCLIAPKLAREVELPILVANGTTKLVDGVLSAIKNIELRKEWYHKNQIEFFTPIIVLMTDGEADPDQDIDVLSEKIQKKGKNDFLLLPIGIKGANRNMLSKIFHQDFPPIHLNKSDIQYFFNWFVKRVAFESTSKSKEFETLSHIDWTAELHDQPHKLKIAITEMLKGDSIDMSISDKTVINKPKEYVERVVFYGTNRKRSGKNKPKDFYSLERSKSLDYGTCNVSIPFKHRQGELELPGKLEKLFKIENPKNHMLLISLNTLESNAFHISINNKLDEFQDEKSALIFIHGYNVTFEKAMLRTAQLAYDLNFKGVPISFSWPSRGTTKGYPADEASIEASVIYFQNFITDILEKTNVNKLHLIAHSMGNRVLTSALREMKHLKLFPNVKINQIILAAPDIDAQVFKETIIPAIKGQNRITLYASSKDKALIASQKIRAGYIRAGQAGEHLCVVDGVDTIDASQVKTHFLGHSYFASSKSLIDDIFMLIKNELPPDKRNLKEAFWGVAKDKYWIFPKI